MDLAGPLVLGIRLRDVPPVDVEGNIHRVAYVR